MILFSAHADTNFRRHRLRDLGDGWVEGHLDNFGGVHAVMLAYFSGRLDNGFTRIELTEGEEDDMAGARRVVRQLKKRDTVFVVDVTGTPTERDFVIEECADPELTAFVQAALAGLSYDLYAHCPDPIAQESETWVYRRRCRRTCFLGLPCVGGDYNAGPVRTRRASLTALAEAIGRLAQAYREATIRNRA
jgi:hypothetical protein